MSFELEGKLVEKFNTQQVSDAFKKREFVVETTEEGSGRVFTEQIKFQLVQDKCDLIESINIDDTVKVSFNIKGRKWEKDGRVNYFTNLDAWRVESQKAQATVTNDAPPPMEEPPMATEEDDDLPF